MKKRMRLQWSHSAGCCCCCCCCEHCCWQCAPLLLLFLLLLLPQLLMLQQHWEYRRSLHCRLHSHLQSWQQGGVWSCCLRSPQSLLFLLLLPMAFLSALLHCLLPVAQRQGGQRRVALQPLPSYQTLHQILKGAWQLLQAVGEGEEREAQWSQRLLWPPVRRDPLLAAESSLLLLLGGLKQRHVDQVMSLQPQQVYLPAL